MNIHKIVTASRDYKSKKQDPTEYKLLLIIELAGASDGNLEDLATMLILGGREMMNDV
jgi:hypothetical protein